MSKAFTVTLLVAAESAFEAVNKLADCLAEGSSNAVRTEALTTQLDRFDISPDVTATQVAGAMRTDDTVPYSMNMVDVKGDLAELITRVARVQHQYTEGAITDVEMLRAIAALNIMDAVL